MTLTVEALQNGDTAVEKLILNNICNTGTFPTELEILPTSGGNGDPHFYQPILNKKFNETQNICYDITGNRGQFVKIFSQLKKNVEIIGQLKDDYYFHEISLQFHNVNIQIKTNQISLSPNLKLKWTKMVKNDWSKHENFFFKSDNNFIIIKKNKTDKISFGIKRITDLLGRFYLDIFVFGLSVDYSDQDGLIGQIGNNKISIYPPVQAENDERRTVIVNGMKTTGYKKVRNGVSCFLVDVNHLLHPYKLNRYLL